MKIIRGVILAAIALMLLHAGPLPEPLHVRFRLADGVQVVGSMTAWDALGFDGTFGRRSWEELATDDIWRLYRRVMDSGVAQQWIDLGRVLLVTPDGASRAQRAFEQATRIDPETVPAVEAARADATEFLAQQARRREAADAHRLRTRTPEAGSFPPTAWPVLSETQHDQAHTAIVDEAAAILQGGGMSVAPLELPDVLVYSDLDRLEAARWAVHVDSIMRRLKTLFGLGETEPIFAGKAVVFLFRDQDRFRLVEADAFGQLVARKDIGVCQVRDERVFLSFYRAADDHALATAIVHETVHAFMHRYRSPRRLPPWANEGLADYMAAALVPEVHQTDSRRDDALAFIRNGRDVGALMAGTYEDQTWPERNETAHAVGALLVELMINENSARFVAWVDAIKAGKPWPEALAQEFATPPNRFLDTAVQYYRVND